MALADRPPRLEAVYFPTHEPELWARLARVLEASARAHCPDWAVSVRCLTPATPRTAGREGHARNTEKLEAWHAIVQAAADGDRLLLLDADTLILRPLEDLWTQAFDLAYTRRAPSARLPLNGGVIALRVSPATRAVMTAWWRLNLRLLQDDALARDWRRRYGGVNQAALGAVLAGGLPDDAPRLPPLEILALPCVEWNCEDSTWASFDPAVTRILHLKSGLRRTVFGVGPALPALQPLARLWRAQARAVLGATAASLPGAPPSPPARNAVSVRRSVPTIGHEGARYVVTATPATAVPPPDAAPAPAVRATAPPLRRLVNVRLSAAVYDRYCRAALRQRTSVRRLLSGAVTRYAARLGEPDAAQCEPKTIVVHVPVDASVLNAYQRAVDTRREPSTIALGRLLRAAITRQGPTVL